MTGDGAIEVLGKETKFWSENQPGFRFSAAPVGSSEFYADVERHRYSLEDHIPDVVGFSDWKDKDVLEAGSGIATDGIQFARAGARYTAFDGTPEALELARRRFELEGLDGSFVGGLINDLPFTDGSFDLVFSHGVIHHIADPEGAVREFFRVLRPGGTALVMVYHRNSFNYRVTIMMLRRLLAPLVLFPRGPAVVASLTGESAEVIAGHRKLFAAHGIRYLANAGLFLSNNTDGPGNPLSRVYSRREAARMFARFDRVCFETRGLNLRVFPGGNTVARSRVGQYLGRRVGWHLYARAEKAE